MSMEIMIVPHATMMITITIIVIIGLAASAQSDNVNGLPPST
jgi:hypothetical protein